MAEDKLMKEKRTKEIKEDIYALNLKIDYAIDGKKMKESIEKLNHFFK